eukprot:7123511-Alexandrium_andersonii.AAC.1
MKCCPQTFEQAWVAPTAGCNALVPCAVAPAPMASKSGNPSWNSEGATRRTRGAGRSQSRGRSSIRRGDTAGE